MARSSRLRTRTRRRNVFAPSVVFLALLSGSLAAFGVQSHVLAWVGFVALGSGGTWAMRRQTLRHRRRITADRLAQLHRASSLAAADDMSGSQFEQYVAELLRCDGYKNVVIVGGPGDGGADILAVDEVGHRIAVQCKRQTAPVGVAVVRQLIGTLVSEHPGRAGLLVTTALLTKPANDLAIRAGIRVVDRYRLAAWMNRIRDRSA